MGNFAIRKINKQKMQCEKCAFIYDPVYGDQESNISPMTNFEEIPEEWHCPICDAPKTDFTPYQTHL